ncbi:hypothetical protein BCR43DRAFT_510658 [Syncephalastrum racemosum]|uniref:Uncharacterized protein n=1 Tax=Syncephalastrum racemosum TaxID=13706 RepID=A0A1X2HVJ1_SYNRA|nr:hypothetical protein BCR43DRAFT_510658 [Syncephalastrum racemosum]
MFNPDEFSDEYRDEPVEIASEVHSEHETALSAEKVKSNTASRPEGASPVGKRGPPTAGEDQSKPVITSAQEESAPKSVAGSQPSSMPASPSTSTAVSATPASYKQKPARRRILPWAKESEASSKKTKRSGKQEDTEAKEASKKKRKTTDYTVKQTKQGYAKSKKDEPNEGENVMPKEKTPQRRKAATPISHESEDEDMQEASRSPPPKRTARPRRAATSKQKSYSVPSDDDSQGEQVMNRTGKRTAMQNEQGPSPDANLPEDIRGSADNDRMMTEAGPPSTGALGDESDATTDDESLGPILRASQTGQIDSQRSAMSWEENQKNNEITQKSRTEDLFDELGL